MNKYDNSNSGALFKNDKKESEKHPDYRGQINVAGTEYWLSAWLKKSKAGNNYMSLAVQPKEAKEAGQEPQKDFDDKIPFMWGAIIPVGVAISYAVQSLFQV